MTDHGLGVPEDELATVFEPFRRGHAERRAIAGSGLGLYISSEIAKRHGGMIRVESEAGLGSTFRVTLPLHSEAISVSAEDHEL